MPNIYKEIKNLFEASDEAIEIYKYLKCTMSSGLGDTLYIYETTREAEKEFWEYVTRYRGVTYNTEKRTIYFPEDEMIYFKSINECKRKLDGYKFKKIKFKGE